jgi:hypothetical protein
MMTIETIPVCDFPVSCGALVFSADAKRRDNATSPIAFL